MLDMTTAERNALDELEMERAKNADLTSRLDAETETNERLLAQLNDKDIEIDKLKNAFDQMKAACEKKAAELELRVQEEKQRCDAVCKQVDAQMSDNIQLQFQRDCWKQTAKWLVKQVGGGKHD